MKSCPLCHTRYEDHVPTCLADGATLVPMQGPVDFSESASAVILSPRKRSRAGLGLLLLVPPLVIVVLVAVGATYLLLSGRGGTRRALDPTSALQPEPGLVDDDFIEDENLEVSFNSSPPGAEVWENGHLLCSTPCSIQHPLGVPLPREFVLKAEGHREATHSMQALEPQFVELSPTRSAPAPRPSEAPSTTTKPPLFIER